MGLLCETIQYLVKAGHRACRPGSSSSMRSGLTARRVMTARDGLSKRIVITTWLRGHHGVPLLQAIITAMPCSLAHARSSREALADIFPRDPRHCRKIVLRDLLSNDNAPVVHLFSETPRLSSGAHGRRAPSSTGSSMPRVPHRYRAAVARAPTVDGGTFLVLTATAPYK